MLPKIKVSLIALMLFLCAKTSQGQSLTLTQLSYLFDTDNNTRDLYLSSRGWQLVESKKEAGLNSISWGFPKPDSTVGAIVNVLYGGKGKILMYVPSNLEKFNHLRESALKAGYKRKRESIVENGTRTVYYFNKINLSFMTTYEKKQGITNADYSVMLDNQK